ncbi:hypothetical protein GCM10008018_54010 [Paenibacillus marchantiophytorum]|uniref:Uncharacterized protein n=1 Tax=Paenibacillus marchantiophytorum TaxID=1619310 RepID=A0ABQ1F6V4_9BACL|nr:hypothetical protein [Paenibacillus marchantiophytorum]GGA00946.1 hypothetical protein GCM10008018_54010 [Paenibacillus marchantiophytorum]
MSEAYPLLASTAAFFATAVFGLKGQLMNGMMLIDRKMATLEI